MSNCIACGRLLYTVCMKDPCAFRKRSDEHSLGNTASTVRKTFDLDTELRRLGIPRRKVS